MKNTLFILTFLLLISKSYALEINCFTDYHVLAVYEDGSGKAIERVRENFTLNFEEDNIDFFELNLMGRQVGALTGPIYSESTDGTGEYVDGVHMGILDPKTNQKLTSVTPLTAKRSNLSVMLYDQPGILENEIYRHYFWTIGCYW